MFKGKIMFKLKSDFAPCGDQPKAIDTLVKSINNNNKLCITFNINQVQEEG